MKIGFTVNLGNDESMYVESSEQETGQDALSEVVEFLRRVQEPHVQEFTKELLKVRIKEDEEEG